MSFSAAQSSPDVTKAPFVQAASISDTDVVEISFSNMTDHVTIANSTASGTTTLGIAFTSAAFSGTNFVGLQTGESITLTVRVKSIFLKKITGTSVNYFATGALNRIESATYPDITTANGFEKV